MECNLGQKQHKGSDVTMETRRTCLLWGRNDLKALLALGIKDLWLSFEMHGKFS
jgi:hypothetical protein